MQGTPPTQLLHASNPKILVFHLGRREEWAEHEYSSHDWRRGPQSAQSSSRSSYFSFIFVQTMFLNMSLIFLWLLWWTCITKSFVEFYEGDIMILMFNWFPFSMTWLMCLFWFHLCLYIYLIDHLINACGFYYNNREMSSLIWKRKNWRLYQYNREIWAFEWSNLS